MSAKRGTNTALSPGPVGSCVEMHGVKVQIGLVPSWSPAQPLCVCVCLPLSMGSVQTMCKFSTDFPPRTSRLGNEGADVYSDQELTSFCPKTAFRIFHWTLFALIHTLHRTRLLLLGQYQCYSTANITPHTFRRPLFFRRPVFFRRLWGFS